MPTYTMKPIEKVTLSAAQSSVTFSNIPSDYTDLFIRCSVRSSSTTGNSNLFVYFNSTTGTSYRVRSSFGDGNGNPVRVDLTNQPWIELSPIIPNENGTFTSNSFANAEIWIQDYRKTSVKTAINGFFAAESNIASVRTGTIHADFNNASSPITSVTIDGTDNFVAGSTFILYGVASASKTASTYASGGDIIGTDGTYWYHAFLSTGSFVPGRALTTDILLVAGGGGASGGLGGGGGAGGVLLVSSQSLSATSYTVTVGGGGSGGGNATTAGTNGVNSTFGAFTSAVAVGGGRGGYDYTTGANGGSGGGASWLSSTGGSPTSTQGHYGAYGYYDGFSGGGGGGAGGPGITAGTNSRGGEGGIGTSAYSNWGIITGTGVASGSLRYYAGGGGGGASNSGIGTKYYDGGYGGTGGGGYGGGNNGSPNGGSANTGGGGGGGGGNSPVYGGAGGGSGIVIVRYKI